VGNAFGFVLAWLCVRHAPNGRLHLRIDDIDAARTRQAFVEDIFQTLDWLGIEWDSGPSSVVDFYTNHSQQLRLAQYYNTLESLAEKQLLFACTCSRKQLQELHPRGLYTGTCVERCLPLHTAEAAWRLNTMSDAIVSYAECHPILQQVEVSIGTQAPYPVLRGKNRLPAYQLVSVWEDVTQGIDWVVRGEDLRDSTALQVYLAGLLPELVDFQKCMFLHHPLVTLHGQKLSKSAGAKAIQSLRGQADGRSRFFTAVAQALGLPVAVPDLEQLYQACLAYPVQGLEPSSLAIL
jgi:glutamyl-tRNA synthetase